MKNKLSGMTRRTALLRRFQSLAVWLLAVVLIGLGGCEKDRFAEQDFSVRSTQKSIGQITDESIAVEKSLNDIPLLKSRITY